MVRISFETAATRFCERITPGQDIERLSGVLFQYKARNLSTAETALGLKTRFELSSSPEEIELALRESGLVSLVLSSLRMDKILEEHAQKIEGMHTVLEKLEGATTAFDVDQIIARGGMEVLGFSRVVAYDILPERKIRSYWEWKRIGENLEQGPYLDSYFAEPRPPLKGEAMDEVLNTRKYVVVHDPANDLLCQVRPAQNPGPFALFPGNGTVYMFDTWRSERPIRPEDLHILDVIVKAGAAKKQIIKAQHRERIEKMANDLRRLFTGQVEAKQVNHRMDLIKLFLISLTYSLAVNRAVFFKWRPRLRELKGVFALGSTSREEFHEALSRIKPGSTEEDIFKLLKDNPRVDSKLNEAARRLVLKEEITGMIVVRGGKAYDPAGREITPQPECLDQIKEAFGSEDFALVPIRDKKILGLLYLDNSWTGRDVDVEAAQRMGQDLISFWVQMRRSEEREEEEKRIEVWAQHQIDALNLLKTWIDVCREEEEKASGRKLVADSYYRLLWQEGQEVHNTEELRRLVENSARRLLIPEKMINLEIEEGSSSFTSCEWINVLVEGALLEALRHFGVRVEAEEGMPPHIRYLPNYKIWIKVHGRYLTITDNGQEKGAFYSFLENADLGETLIRKADQDMREAGVGGVQLRLSPEEIQVFLLS